MGGVLDRPSALGFPGLGAAAKLLQTIGRYFQQARLSEEEEHALQLLVAASATVGRPVLLATDQEDLDRRIDDLVGSAELYSVLERVFAATPPSLDGATLDQLREATAVERATFVAMSFGLGAGQRLLRGIEHVLAVAEATKGLDVQTREPALDEFVRRAKADPLWFVADRSFAPEEARLLLGGLRFFVCLLAISEVFFSAPKLSPWLSLGIAERWERSTYSLLRLVASIPGSAVSTDLVPAADRLDLKRAEEAARRTHAHVDGMVAAAARSEDSVYPPDTEFEDG